MFDDTVTRRNFLRVSGAAMMTASVSSLAHAQAKSTAKKSWVVACRDAHLKEVKVESAWAAMKAINVQGAEVEVNDQMQCPNLYHPSQKYGIDTPQAISALADELKKQEVKITAFMMSNRFDERPEEELRMCAQVVEACKTLGIKAIRIDVWPRKLKGDEYLRFAIETGKKLVALTAGSDVHFAIENHGNTTNRPDFLHTLFDGIGSPDIGLTMDTANFYWYGHPLSKLYDIYREFAPRVFHTHCKSIHYPEDKREQRPEMGWEYGKYCCPIFEGDIDFSKVTSILREAKYKGDLCIEDESIGKFPQEERMNVLHKEAELLHQFA